MNPTQIVQEGYDRIANLYAKKRPLFDNSRELSELYAVLPFKARILDAGCGTGLPILRALTERGYHATGVDLSRGMLDLAALNAPEARLFRADIRELHFDDNIFDGIICSYALFHVPRAHHTMVLQSFNRILKDNGHLLISLGATAWEATQDFMGVPMYWSNGSAEHSMELIKTAGLDILWHRPVTTLNETHIWVLARKKHAIAHYSLQAPPPPPWQVYVLECVNDSLYTGVTNNLENRFKLHQNGKGAKYTRMHPPTRILLTLPALSKSEALQMEIWFKGRDHNAKKRLIDNGSEYALKIWYQYKETRDGNLPIMANHPKPPRIKKVVVPKKKKAAPKKGRLKKKKK